MVEKQDKAKVKNQILKIKQLALSNKQAEAQLSSFKNILSDLLTDDKSSQSFNNQTSIEDPQLFFTNLTSIPHIAAQLKNMQKKKAINRLLFD